MVEKNLKSKTTKVWGEGGDIRSLQPKGGLFYFVSLLLIFSLAFQPVAFAARSSAGGGKIAKPDWGKVALSAGISIGSAIVLPAISSGIKSVTPVSVEGASLGTKLGNTVQGFGKFITNTGTTEAVKPWGVAWKYLGQGINFTNVVTGYSTFVATTQVNRAVGMMGSYYGWKPSSTFMLSSVATGMTAGLLDPVKVLGSALPDAVLNDTTAKVISSSTMVQGAFVGGLTGLASSAAIVAVAGDRINQNKELGVSAQIAGLVAGTAAGNFGRELIKPTPSGPVIQCETVSEPSFQELAVYAENWLTEPSSARPISVTPTLGEIARFAQDWLDETPSISQSPKLIPVKIFYEIKHANLDFDTQPLDRIKLSEEQAQVIRNNLESGLFKPRILGKDIIQIVPADVHVTARGLFDATVIKTLDMWPQFASRALALAVAGSSSDEGASLKSSLVEGISSAVISGIAGHLKPGLYFGKDKLVNRIEYVNNMAQAVLINNLDSLSSDLYAAYEKGEGSKARYEEILIRHGFDINRVKVPDISESLSFDKFKELLLKDLEQGKPKLTWIAYQEQLNYIDNLRENDFNRKPQVQMMAIALSRAQVDLESRMKDAMKIGGLAAAFKVAGTDRNTFLRDNLTKDAKFSLVEGLVSGGVSYLVSNWSKDDAAKGALAGYGATMLTAAVRGILLHTNWEQGYQNGNMVWADRYSLFAPQDYQGDDWWEKAISESVYPQDLARYNKFVRYAGVPADTLMFKGASEKDRPELGETVLMSLVQANREFLNRSFAFGAPQVKPKYINALMVTDYLNSLRGYTLAASQSGGLSAALNQSYINAASQAISTNVMTSLATSKKVADAFNIQQQRLVKTNSPINPYTIQMRDYRPWALNVQTSFYLPWPNDNYRALSTTGKSFIRDK